jgi:uncharacterized protein
MGERTAFDRTFAGALGQLLGIEVPQSIADEEARAPVTDPVAGEDEEEVTDEETTDPDATAEELLVGALQAFADAEDALRAGDLAGYQRNVATAQRLIEEAAEVQGVDVADLLVDDAEQSDAELLEELGDLGEGETTDEGELTDDADADAAGE